MNVFYESKKSTDDRIPCVLVLKVTEGRRVLFDRRKARNALTEKQVNKIYNQNKGLFRVPQKGEVVSTGIIYVNPSKYIFS